MSTTARQGLAGLIGDSVDCVETPALIVDLDVMEENIRRWQAAADAAGVAFRPHAKTHKAPAVAARQLAAGAVGLAVAKVAEAEVFAAAGCRDLAVAYPVVGPAKWRRLAALARTCTITVNVESEVAARGLSAAAVAAGSVLRVHLDVDNGLHRCGVPAEAAETLGRLVLGLPGLELEGITTFRSVIFPGSAGRSLDELGREEGALMVGLAERPRGGGAADPCGRGRLDPDRVGSGNGAGSDRGPRRRLRLRRRADGDLGSGGRGGNRPLDPVHGRQPADGGAGHRRRRGRRPSPGTSHPAWWPD